MNLRDRVQDALADIECRARSRPLEARSYRFGGLSITVRVPSCEAMRGLLHMIEARRSPQAAGSALIDLVGGPASSLDRLIPSAGWDRQNVLHADSDIYYLWLKEAGGYLTVIDRRERKGLVWFAAPERIASWHVARPLLHAIKGLSLDTEWTPIHAASAARDGRAILAVGLSGAGKSSIAMACALAGWEYLGDDAVIVRADPARVGALYSSARLRVDTFSRFPRAMLASVGVSNDSGEAKAEVDVGLLQPPANGEADVAAIVLPRRAGWDRLRLEPLPRSTALGQLMAATRQSIRGDEAASFEKLARLVAAVPAYALSPGDDQAALTDCLAELAERGRTT